MLEISHHHLSILPILEQLLIIITNFILYPFLKFNNKSKKLSDFFIK